MTTFGKVLIGLALALPMAAYVVGSLAGSSAEQPRPRDPVQISDVTESPTPGKRESTPPDDQGDDDGDRDDTDDDGDDNGARVVVPQPTRVDGGDDARPEGPDDDSRGGDDTDDDGDDDGGGDD